MTDEEICAQTPRLLLDEPKMLRNIARLRARLDALGVDFRPHLKTAKSEPVLLAMSGGTRKKVAVSTLAEAEFAFERGWHDILYAVAISPSKLTRASGLVRRGATLILDVDSAESVRALNAHARDGGETLDFVVEIDADGHRSGVRADSAELGAILAEAATGPCRAAGVMAHAGAAYELADPKHRAQAAEAERRSVAVAAERMRAAGMEPRIVSVGSTPTAHAAQRLDGVTEVRAGVFVFFDLFMAGIGVCGIDDVALSVEATVIGRMPSRNRVIVDAGWMALSRDRGTARQSVDQGYGLVCDKRGTPMPDVVVLDANQEHGIVGMQAGSSGELPAYRIGDVVRILPNHACATAAQHAEYLVLGADGAPRAVWPRIRGW